MNETPAAFAGRSVTYSAHRKTRHEAILGLRAETPGPVHARLGLRDSITSVILRRGLPALIRGSLHSCRDPLGAGEPVRFTHRRCGPWRGHRPVRRDRSLQHRREKKQQPEACLLRELGERRVDGVVAHPDAPLQQKAAEEGGAGITSSSRQVSLNGMVRPTRRLRCAPFP